MIFFLKTRSLIKHSYLPPLIFNFSDFDLIYVKSLAIAKQYLGNSVGKLVHKLVFPVQELPTVYELINDLTTPKLIILSKNNANRFECVLLPFKALLKALDN